ncbi:NACHT domain-containing protein [Comamonas thiooxydans]|uniref:NACHT domain-containing protein n=1 Tax=Comamonas thiooxydans TaxID=363952 RepID=UPI0021157935|nr:NACHT domain-containing protein [Comamonas thiooxydans]UUE96176.1 NACHT domain-containing protein [Comamonas thiooxydans]
MTPPLTPNELVLASVGIKAAVTALAKPVASATFSGLKTVASSIIDIFTNRLTDYILQQEQRHSYLSTIVFQHQKSLDELYIPLTLRSATEAIRNKTTDEIKVDKFQEEIFSSNGKVLITDTAGMGKSTLSKFLFLECLRSNHKVPFFIELRHLTDKSGVLDVLTKQLNPPTSDEDEPKFQKKHIQRMLKKNELLFIFDGYDEIIPAHRETITKNLKELIEIYPQHNYVITSRPESGLLAFPAFRQFHIKPLNPDESYELIRKYDNGCGKSEQLISTLKKTEYRSVREFLANPLLCSLLFRSFEYKQSIPLKKHVFYRQVYDALYDWHDASKDGYNTREKLSGLDIDAFHRMLRVVGFYSVMTGKIEGDRDTVLGWIRKSKDVCHFKHISESNFLEDLIKAVPLFVRDGDKYRWSHKSLSEYFAAQYICTEGKSDQQRTLEAIIDSKDYQRFSNMLDQIYDVDNNAFRQFLVRPAAIAFKEHFESSYRNADPSIEESELRLRRSVSFDKEIIILDKFNFESAKEVREELSKIDEIAKSKYINSEVMKLFMFASTPILVLEGKHSFIINLLASKRDPLVQRQEFIHPNKGNRPNISKSTIAVTDDPTLSFNSPDSFSKMTRLLSGFIPIANADNMLKFEDDFKGQTHLSNLTDELLGNLNK